MLCGSRILIREPFLCDVKHSIFLLLQLSLWFICREVNLKCTHCGEDCLSDKIVFEEKNFCCSGCKTVFEILNLEGLENYYNIESTPGISQKHLRKKSFDFVDNEKVKEQIYEFTDGEISRIRIYLPTIHCSSCIWLLENLNKLHKGIVQCRVDFVKKEAAIVFKEELISLKELLHLLDKIGYSPDLVNSIENKKNASHKSKTSKALIYKIGIAGFSFGNIMLLSFPEYLDVLNEISPEFANNFRYISFLFVLPVMFYSANDYFVSAYKSLRSKYLNIDVPISIGIVTLFLRSTIDVFVYQNIGYYDSLAGLVFFLLVGKWFQEKTYNALSFDRDFKSFFPLAFKVEQGGKQIFKTLEEIVVNDIAIIRNGEVVPADGVLLDTNVGVDYSFVTGESVPVVLKKGENIFAGGQILGSSASIKLTKEVSNSYLIKLWNERDDQESSHQKLLNTIDKISQNFTFGVLSIAIVASIYWGINTDWGKAVNIFTAVLIVACPCALALAAPFTFGHAIRFLGKKDIFFKNTSVIEKLTSISTLVFDKTGTLTDSSRAEIEFKAFEKNKISFEDVKLISQNSTHPLSALLSMHLDSYNSAKPIGSFEEVVGKGMLATIENNSYILGSYEFLKENEIELSKSDAKAPKVYLAINGKYKGLFVFHNKYRAHIFRQILELKKHYKIVVLSGDEDYEAEKLALELGSDVTLKFNQSPFDKRNFIKELQDSGEVVAMFGDGLNDAGALSQSDAGISIIENIGSFSPASDIIIKSNRLSELNKLFHFSIESLKLLKLSLMFSLFYNLIGMSFAVSGKLTPLVAAILMPLSSISVVGFVSLGIFYIAKRNNLDSE